MPSETTSPYSGPERRTHPHISEEQVEAIAARAAELAIEKVTNHVYRTVGKSVITKAIWLIGASAVGAYLWLRSNGWIR